MATIGSFTQTQTGFSGDITTLTIPNRKVAIVAETERSGERAPTHRIYRGKAEIGAGWAKRSKEERAYISIKLDDASLPAPLYAALCGEEDGKTYSLIWTRPNGRRRD
ncbi:hypothetical protein OPKNFCMD_5297 [Methylobacterium crusticola]|uniref:DUF736 domain-containing protein n=1 Tax=Methylobacterium crusticola TaxID=1697972 RepID=A0ABQ4R4B5_9HYPH|nr:DUF736 domain-containing protein [Methylobacterium crusticola]GJD52531.1 hypothetical protein OPKNFCMD_5297 [Methylobacterium crusticola]